MFSAISELTNVVFEIVGGIFSFMIAIIVIASIWRLYTIKGYKGWYMFIPIYNLYILCKIANVSVWLLLLLLVPFVRAIVVFYLYYMTAKAYNRGLLFTIGLIVLPVIFIPIMAFDD